MQALRHHEGMTDEKAPGQVVAVWLSSLFMGAPELPTTNAEDRQYEVAKKWQRLGKYAVFVDVKGVIAGQPHGRIAEVVSRMASAGEQLMLAAACVRDGRRSEADWADDLGPQVGARALFEMTNYYLLSAAHGLANVTLRVLLLAPGARDLLEKSHEDVQFEPFSADRQAWISLNRDEMKKMRKGVADGPPELAALVQVLTDLLGTAAWSDLNGRRGVDFHRHRPQSIDGGAPVTNQWKRGDDGQTMVLSIGGVSDFQPLEVTVLQAESVKAAAVLTAAMATWLEALPPAFQATIGDPVFRERTEK